MFLPQFDLLFSPNFHPIWYIQKLPSLKGKVALPWPLGTMELVESLIVFMYFKRGSTQHTVMMRNARICQKL